jgi:hypothetical protein
MISFIASNIPGFVETINNLEVDQKNGKYYSIISYSTKANQKYNIIRYIKDFITTDLISTYGLLRSVILSGKKIVGFSPPKSLSADTFMKKYPLKSNIIVAEEFIEGTMINVFFDHDLLTWQIATRNTVGGEVSFYKLSDKTFNDMFMEACQQNNFHLITLNPKFCYSFVLQHPHNRIVLPIKKPKLYLISVYEIIQKDSNIIIQEQNLSFVKQGGLWDTTGIKFAERYEFANYSELINRFTSANTSYDIMGVVIKNIETGERTKIRNPIYEEVRHLRGNQPKLQYQYLSLRHSGKLSEYLKYFPETKEEMSKYRDQVHMFTNTLHNNYISCYVKKERPLREFPDQYRTHMFKIHAIFLNELREQKLFVSNTVVIRYVNALHPSLLMYCLNHNMRKKMVDTIKLETSFE